jgi:CheY-like chemotaxis protein
VEDNDINRLYARSILKNWQCFIDVAENGLVAIEKIKNNHFDVVLMDVQMPVMDGYEATKAIRLMDQAAAVPIIALTANATVKDVEKCFAAGMNDYLPKPFTPEDLYRKLFDDLKITPLTPAKPIPVKIPATSYNLTYLRTVSGNNEEFIREMVSTFVQTIPPVLAEIQKCIQDNDWARLSRLVHQVKPSFILMGIDSMRSDIIFIEENSKLEANLTKVVQMAHEFIARCNAILPQLSQDILQTH